MATDSGVGENNDPLKTESVAPVLSPPSKIAKKESLRLQKQTYKLEKKKAGEDLKMSSRNPAVVILSDWLKVRSTLKNWTRMWCVINPGMLIFYKNSKMKTWIGTVLLASVEIIERPSKKQGMCFKIYHLLDQCIWAPKGPKGETTSFLTNSLPSSHVILRAQTESDGQCWIDAVELAKNCSKLLKRSMESSLKRRESVKHTASADGLYTESLQKLPSNQLDIMSFESTPSLNNASFDLADLQDKLTSAQKAHHLSSDENKSLTTNYSDDHRKEKVQKQSNSIGIMYEEHYQSSSSESCASDIVSSGKQLEIIDDTPPTTYIANISESLGEAGEDSQVEELAGENKNLLWLLLKQVRPGMDLSKVVLPTFILEPRSFLDKLSDYYYHADLLAKAAVKANAFDRIKGVTRWYLSGFYKKPEGLKKPYNPILGETFRCKWEHPDDGSKTFYIAEQVSHHPPISAFVVINRKAGFTVQGTILAKSKYYGNSVSAILEGSPIVRLLNLGEDYRVTLPYAHCKGILYGKMSMELGGKVKIKCEKTGYTTELDFKLKKLFGGTGKVNEVSGRILLGQRVLATFSGCWDQEILMTDLNHGSVEEFWCPNEFVKKSRLLRYTVDPLEQGDMESEKLWKHVTAAIIQKDQNLATEEKTKLEVTQREGAKYREENHQPWISQYFEYNLESDEYEYKYLDARPWDTLNDIEEFESCGIIATKTINKTSPVRNMGSSAAVVSIDRTVSSASTSHDITPIKSVPSQLDQSVLMRDIEIKITDAIAVGTQPLFQKQEAVMMKLISLQKELIATRKQQDRTLNIFFIVFILLSVLVAFSLHYYNK